MCIRDRLKVGRLAGSDLDRAEPLAGRDHAGERVDQPLIADEQVEEAWARHFGPIEGTAKPCFECRSEATRDFAR